MSPRYFSKMLNNNKRTKAELEYEQKVEDAVKAIVAVIAAPFKKIIKKD